MIHAIIPFHVLLLHHINYIRWEKLMGDKIQTIFHKNRGKTRRMT